MSVARRNLWVPWLASALFWLFVGVLYIGQIWWLQRTPGVRVNINYRTTFAWQGAFYGLWIPLSVVIWRITASWEVATLGWRRVLLRHLALAAVVCLAQSMLVVAVAMPLTGAGNESVSQAIWGQLRSRLYQQVVIYVAIVMTGHAFVLYDRWRAREIQAAQLEAQLTAARLDALRAQLHPHFLFNSLHTIASLVRDERNADAVRLISALGDLLRRGLDSTDQRIPLGEEVDLLQRYIDIQSARFGDRLRIAVDVEPGLAGASVPSWLIQPLVENAIQHGFSTLPGGGTITVSARHEPGTIAIAVEDTGAGVPPGWSLDRTTGTGLKNLRARLAALYGSHGAIEAGGRPAGGFTVRVTLPADAVVRPS